MHPSKPTLARERQAFQFELYFVRHGAAYDNPVKGLMPRGERDMAAIGRILRKSHRKEGIALLLAASDWQLVRSAEIIRSHLGRDVLYEHIDPFLLFETPTQSTGTFYGKLRDIAERTGVTLFVIVTHEPIIKRLCNVKIVPEGSLTRLSVVSTSRNAEPEPIYYQPTFVKTR